MGLLDFNPHWIGLNTIAKIDFYFGVSFDCPHCREKRLAVKFWPPIDPDGLLETMTPISHDGFHQRVSGDTFETLTIAPSIGFEGIGHWHGHITNGEVSTS